MPDGERGVEEAGRVADNGHVAEELPTSHERSHDVEPIPEENAEANILAASTALGDAIASLQHIRDTLHDAEIRNEDDAQNRISASASGPVSWHSSSVNTEFEPSRTTGVPRERPLQPPWRTLRYTQSDSPHPRDSMPSYTWRMQQNYDTGNHLPGQNRLNSSSSVQGYTLPSRREGLNSSLAPVHTRSYRPRRNSNPSDTTSLRRRNDITPAEDQASTTLGRRVAMRSAAAERLLRETGSRWQAPQTSGSSRSTLTDHLYPPRTVSGSTSTSQTLHPTAPGTLGYARQRINELLEWEDDELAIGLRPANVNDDDADLPELRHVSRASSPGLVRSDESPATSSTSSSWRPREERIEAASQRMREMQERLDHIQSSLFTASNERAFERASGDLIGYPAARTIPVGQRLTSRDYYWEYLEEEGRSYRTRRRMNANGEEYVHRIQTDGWFAEDNAADDGGTNGEPLFEQYVPVRRASSTAREGSARATALRRETSSAVRAMFRQDFDNWSRSGQRKHRFLHVLSSHNLTAESIARLNADGDPIVEPENADPLFRLIRRRRESRAGHAISGSTRTRLEFLPSTSSDILDRDIEEIEVCLGEECDDGIRILGTSEPYYICPLPIPLESKEKSPILRQPSLPELPTIAFESRSAAR